jgi:glycogen synthase
MPLWKPTRPVLMTADPIGGVWTYALELCRELGKTDVAVALATMGRRLNDEERAAVRDISNVELFESDYKLEWMTDPWDDVKAAGEWLLDLESRTAPSLIHLNGYCHGALRWKVPSLIVGHSCVYSWFEAVKATPPGREWQPYKQLVTIGLRGADLVTAPSEFMLSALKRHYGGFAAADPIYNGRRAAEFAPRAKEPLIISAGRLWDEAKNIAILQHVGEKVPWAICAAGENRGPDGNYVPLKGLVSLGPLTSNMLARWLGRAAIFVLPARYEPFGFSALEAALAGCALVLGDVPSLREIWADSALFVSPHDPDNIAAALVKLIEDTSLRQNLSERARSRALSLTPQRMAQGYLNLYERLLSGGSQTIGELFSNKDEE